MRYFAQSSRWSTERDRLSRAMIAAGMEDRNEENDMVPKIAAQLSEGELLARA